MSSKTEAKNITNRVVRALGNGAWTENLNQKVGIAYDFITPEGLKIEVKADLMSCNTGNFFLETKQTLDSGVTWVPSGITLAIEQADFVLFISSKEEIIAVSTPVLSELLNTPGFRKKRTNHGANGNRDANAAIGMLVSRQILRSHACEIYRLDLYDEPELLHFDDSKYILKTATQG